MVGIILVFAGFLALGILGGNYQTSNIEKNAFGNCFAYSEDKEPIPVDCSAKTLDQILFFAAVVSLIVGGLIALLKGLRGDWDSKVKPEDMVGPGGNNITDKKDQPEK